MAEPSLPEVWRKVLLDQLDIRARDVALAEDYYEGRHPLPTPPARMMQFHEARTAFENLSRLGVTNYIAPVVDAPAARLRVIGFRSGDAKDLKADAEAWRDWTRNNLQADSKLVTKTALMTGQAFVMVWPDVDGEARTTVEHPSQAIVAYTPGSQRQRAAALKRWIEDDGSQRCVLYLPDNVYKWQANRDSDEWKQWAPNGETFGFPNPMGRVPVVEFRANPSLKPTPFGGGCTEFEKVLTIQDRINKTVFDRLVTAEWQAFRQRWAVGWTPDSPDEAIKASVRHFLSFEDPEVKVGEFSQADFTPFISAVENDVKAMAAITSTPFYTLGELANPPSGDALMALQSGLVSKTEDHRDNFGESWEEVRRLQLAAKGDSRADDQQSTVIWRSVAHVTWAEIADAAVKMKSVGVPDEALWLMFPDVTPQDIERWRVMKADEQLFAPEVPSANSGGRGATQETANATGFAAGNNGGGAR